MAARTPLDDQYQDRMKEQLKGMLRHLQGLHDHPLNTWYRKCQHDMPYRGKPLDAGEYKCFGVVYILC